MALKANGKDAKVIFLNKIPLNGDQLTEAHGILYLRKVANTQTGIIYPKLGQATANSYAGKTPAEVFEMRYTQNSNEGGDPTADYIIVIDAPNEDTVYDELCREEGDRLFKANKITFECLHKRNKRTGYNDEALLNFDYGQFDVLLEKVIKPALGLEDLIDIRKPFVPRDFSTPVGQDLMIDELVEKIEYHKRAAFAGYTGVGKSHIGVASAHKLLPNGGLVLITTPIVDTAQSFEDNIKEYHYADRSKRTAFYRQDSVTLGAIKDLRARANAGELIFLLLTVQDVRYQDEKNNNSDETQIRKKYQELLDVKLDLWIRDEFHKEYGGTETIKIVELLEEQSTYLIDLSATLRNLIEQGVYHLDQIVNRNIFWALKNRHHMAVDPVPELKVFLLGDINHKNLPQDIQDIYDPTEGWNHKKMTETINGVSKYFAGFKGMFTRAYTLEDDIDTNPWAINGHPKLCPESQKVGLWRFPAGDSKMSAQDLYVPLAKQLREQKEFIRANVYITSSWEISDVLPVANPNNPSKPFKTAGEYVEYLKSQYNHVAIITQTKYCTGSDIPCLGHEVLCDNISNPATMEQFFPGRVARRYPNKTDVALFVIAPGAMMKDNINAMAASAKKAEPAEDMTEYLRQIQISKYDASWNEITAEEMFSDFQSNLIEKIRAEVSVQELISIINNQQIQNSLAGLNLTNKELGSEQASKELTKDNESKVSNPETGNEDEDIDEDSELTPVSKDEARVYAQSINAVMVEVPAFAIPENIINIDEAIDHTMIRTMFGDDSIDLILAAIRKCPALHRTLQDKLTEWHSANQNLPYDRVIDQVYKNTERKKKIGLVFLKMDLARELTADVNEVLGG